MKHKPENGQAGAGVTSIEVTPEMVEVCVAAAEDWIAGVECGWEANHLTELVTTILLSATKYQRPGAGTHPQSHLTGQSRSRGRIR